MYFLLLVGHMTFAVMATTITTEPHTQTAHTHLDYTDHSVHGAHVEPTTVASVPALQTMHAKTDVYQVTTDHSVHGAHVEPTTVASVLALQTMHAKTDVYQVNTEKHSTYVTDIHSTGKHSAVTKKEQPAITMKEQPAVTKKEQPAVTKKEQPKTPGKSPSHTVAKLLTSSYSISEPNVRIKMIDNSIHISCISEVGPQVIHYELIQGNKIVKNTTVHGKKEAIFKFNITPESSQLYCKARTPSGEEAISQPLRILGDTAESEDKAGDKIKSEKEERDAGPKFLISLKYILTSVSQPVQYVNSIIISVCGPIILVLLLLIFLIHFCKRRKAKKEPTVPPQLTLLQFVREYDEAYTL